MRPTLNTAHDTAPFFTLHPQAESSGTSRRVPQITGATLLGHPPHRHPSLGLLTIGSAVPVNGPPAFPNLSFLTYEMGMIPLCLVWGRMEGSLTGKAGPKHRAWHTTNAQESTIPSSGRSPKNNEKGQHPTEGGSTAAICIVGGRGKNYWGPLGWCRPSKNPFPFLNPQGGPLPPLCPLACPLPSAGCGDHPQ